jgi:hypothetical protein
VDGAEDAGHDFRVAGVFFQGHQVQVHLGQVFVRFDQELPDDLVKGVAHGCCNPFDSIGAGRPSARRTASRPLPICGPATRAAAPAVSDAACHWGWSCPPRVTTVIPGNSSTGNL